MAVTSRSVRWAAVGLLAVSAAVHLWMFPDHAGLVASAHAHPKKDKQPQVTATTVVDRPAATPGRRRAEVPTPAPAVEVVAVEVVDPAVRYVGWLFLVGAAALLVAARAVRADLLAGWRLGAATCVAMTVGLAAAVTVGLPGGYTTTWEPQAVVCVAAQVGFLGLWGWRERRAQPAGRQPVAVT
jgi:hypothetical protein